MENTETIEIKKVELPAYQVCEHMKEINDVTANIFRLNLEELIYEKMFILFEKLFVADNKYQDAKVELQTQSDKLLLETDFKSMGLTNEKQRNAYMKPLLAELEDKKEEATANVKFYENKLKILNDLISLRKMELRIETQLKEEE